MITGQAKCEFGTGSILVTPLCRTDLQKGALCLQNRGTGKVGEFTSTSYFEKDIADTLLTFENVESIDVLIDRLECLKLMMLGEVAFEKVYDYNY